MEPLFWCVVLPYEEKFLHSSTDSPQAFRYIFNKLFTAGRIFSLQARNSPSENKEVIFLRIASSISFSRTGALNTCVTSSWQNDLSVPIGFCSTHLLYIVARQMSGPVRSLRIFRRTWLLHQLKIFGIIWAGHRTANATNYSSRLQP